MLRIDPGKFGNEIARGFQVFDALLVSQMDLLWRKPCTSAPSIQSPSTRVTAVQTALLAEPLHVARISCVCPPPHPRPTPQSDTHAKNMAKKTSKRIYSLRFRINLDLLTKYESPKTTPRSTKTAPTGPSPKRVPRGPTSLPRPTQEPQDRPETPQEVRKTDLRSAQNDLDFGFQTFGAGPREKTSCRF